MSRLNLQYTVLSKRRLIQLVTKNHVRGWDDPRMPTISGMRRRGYTKEIINGFCNDIGATRAANVVEQTKLDQTARLYLAASTCRAMAALQPILVKVTNFEALVADGAATVFAVQNHPTDESMGSHTITLTPTIYIDASDFRLDDSAQYYGLALNKAVGLKYHGGNLICDLAVQDKQGKVTELHCRLDVTEGRTKPKSYISWVPEDALPAEVRIYDKLFSVPEPTDLWVDELNPTSEVVYANALVDPYCRELVDGRNVDKWKSNTALQFERVGYFVVDYDTTYNPETNEGRLVFNQTVSLKEEISKKKLSAAEEAKIEARRVQAIKDMEAKEARMKISPEDFFRCAEEFKGRFTKFDESTGMPTHDADGLELTKSMLKKLEKEKQKHIKQLSKWSQ
jgi:glutaminyl-tRNA synthetase